MILHPAILALLVTSLLAVLLILYSSWHGVRILGQWDIQSGSELQLRLERRTYLISTILGYAFAFQLCSLFLFIYTADSLHALFSGAMCAVGTLNMNSYGYPTLVIKIVNFLLAGLWLILNHADTRGYDYPLLRPKYAMLLGLAPLILLEAVVQYRFFSGLHADVITSCCGSLFSTEQQGVAGDLAGLPAVPMKLAFYGSMTATFVTGAWFYLKGRGGYLFSALGTLTAVIATAALISVFCLYYYQLPTHHCPFCILQQEYRHVGYALYGALFGGAVAGSGTGLLMPFAARSSMVRVIPPLQRRLTAVTLLLYLLFTLLVSCQMFMSPLRLLG